MVDPEDESGVWPNEPSEPVFWRSSRRRKFYHSWFAFVNGWYATRTMPGGSRRGVLYEGQGWRSRRAVTRTKVSSHIRNSRYFGVTEVSAAAGVKTRKEANLQLTVARAKAQSVFLQLRTWTRTAGYHGFDVIRHSFNGGTHPIDIRRRSACCSSRRRLQVLAQAQSGNTRSPRVRGHPRHRRACQLTATTLSMYRHSHTMLVTRLPPGTLALLIRLLATEPSSWLRDRAANPPGPGRAGVEEGSCIRHGSGQWVGQSLVESQSPAARCAKSADSSGRGADSVLADRRVSKGSACCSTRPLSRTR